MAGPGHRPRYVLGAGRLVDPDRVVTGETGEAPGQEGLQREVPAVLLPDQHHQRRPVHPGGRDRADRVAQPRRGVQQRQRGPFARDGPAGGHADDRALVQGEDELQVVGEPGQQGDLGGPGVGEDRGHAGAAEHVEGRVPHGPHRPGLRRTHRSPLARWIWAYRWPRAAGARRISDAGGRWRGSTGPSRGTASRTSSSAPSPAALYAIRENGRAPPRTARGQRGERDRAGQEAGQEAGGTAHGTSRGEEVRG